MSCIRGLAEPGRRELKLRCTAQISNFWLPLLASSNGLSVGAVWDAALYLNIKSKAWREEKEYLIGCQSSMKLLLIKLYKMFAI